MLNLNTILPFPNICILQVITLALKVGIASTFLPLVNSLWFIALQGERGQPASASLHEDGQHLQIPNRCRAVSQDESIIDSELSLW